MPRDVVFNSLANKAAIDYIKGKVPAASKNWDDWIAPVHAKSFTVAGAPSVEFATDMHEAVTKAISNGSSIAEFRKDFDKIVEQYGWSYKGKRGWRTRIIYDTNMRAARMSAKWQTIQDNKDVAPFLEYVAVNDNRTRPEHRTWDGIIRPVDDAFWDTHYPPNGWNCRCTVKQLSQATMDRQSKTVSDAPNINRQDRTVLHGKGKGNVIQNIPHGIDVGWDHNVGQSWIAPDVALGKKLATMPPLLAGQAYQNQVTPAFMEAVDKAWQTFRSNVKSTHASNTSKFVGFANHNLQAALANKSEVILAKTAEINVKRASSAANNLPQLNSPDLNPENLAFVAPDFKIDHLEGAHKAGSLSQWDNIWIDSLPSLLNDYQAILYDVDSQAVVYVTRMSKEGRHAVAYINLNQSKKRMPVSNWVKSLNTKPLSNLKESRFILLDGTMPGK